MENRLGIVRAEEVGWVGRKWMWLSKGSMRDPCVDGTVLYIDLINANILVMAVYYSFLRCSHWENCLYVFPFASVVSNHKFSG